MSLYRMDPRPTVASADDVTITPLRRWDRQKLESIRKSHHQLHQKKNDIIPNEHDADERTCSSTGGGGNAAPAIKALYLTTKEAFAEDLAQIEVSKIIHEKEAEIAKKFWLQANGTINSALFHVTTTSDPIDGNTFFAKIKKQPSLRNALPPPPSCDERAFQDASSEQQTVKTPTSPWSPAGRGGCRKRRREGTAANDDDVFVVTDEYLDAEKTEVSTAAAAAKDASSSNWVWWDADEEPTSSDYVGMAAFEHSSHHRQTRRLSLKFVNVDLRHKGKGIRRKLLAAVEAYALQNEFRYIDAFYYDKGELKEFWQPMGYSVNPQYRSTVTKRLPPWSPHQLRALDAPIPPVPVALLTGALSLEMYNPRFEKEWTTIIKRGCDYTSAVDGLVRLSLESKLRVVVVDYSPRTNATASVPSTPAGKDRSSTSRSVSAPASPMKKNVANARTTTTTSSSSCPIPTTPTTAIHGGGGGGGDSGVSFLTPAVKPRVVAIMCVEDEESCNMPFVGRVTDREGDSFYGRLGLGIFLTFVAAEWFRTRGRPYIELTPLTSKLMKYYGKWGFIPQSNASTSSGRKGRPRAISSGGDLTRWGALSMSMSRGILPDVPVAPVEFGGIDGTESITLVPPGRVQTVTSPTTMMTMTPPPPGAATAAGGVERSPSCSVSPALATVVGTPKKNCARAEYVSTNCRMML